ncbi:MAG: tRNA preQ1(34) S-adenosylmethionine ribosyltransferase-isomerase QueA [Candidatus Sumerlaeia bacterium]
MNISQFDYDLPAERIARYPAEHRENARLLRVFRDSGKLEDRHVYDLADILREGDLLVLNNTRVFPARLMGTRPPDHGRVEVLLLEPLETHGRWTAMVRPGKKIRTGNRLVFQKDKLEATVVDYGKPGSGERVLEFEWEGDWWECLEQYGHTPLPPYILKARKNLEDEKGLEKPEDRERYQTVYAGETRGSVAAPTAGLHFTEELLEKLKAKGIEKTFVDLHVGAGTFQPVKTDNIKDHPMHEEYFELRAEAADAINRARSEGRRIVAVGTTVVRALETAALLCDPSVSDERKQTVFRTNEDTPLDLTSDKQLAPVQGWTRLLIAPGFAFRMCDLLLTNFHLPRSTLLMLVSAFADRETIFAAYRHAIDNDYRFYSYGDCMLIE